MHSGGNKTGPGVSMRVHQYTAGMEYKRFSKKSDSEQKGMIRASMTWKKEI